MGKASNQNESKELKDLQKSKGALWGKKDDDFCMKLVKEFRLKETLKGLTDVEVIEMLALLINSCRNSLARTKDLSKPSYYGKYHQFTNRHEMLSELIHKKGFLNKWVLQYINYKKKKMRLEQRPTLGRIDHNKGYTLDNLEVQGYNNNASQRAVERFSRACVAIVMEKCSNEAVLFECPSVVNVLSRINEVQDLGITRNMLKGNLDAGLTRFDNDYSVFIISREKLLESPRVIDFGVLMHSIVDDASVRLVALPQISEVGCSRVRLQIDDIGIVYVDFVEESETKGEDLETNFINKVVLK